jgi:hypothetical protein
LPRKSSPAANWVPQKTAARFAVFAILRCSSLFLIFIEIAWRFADHAAQLPRDCSTWTLRAPPVFAENLQALTIFVCDRREPLSIRRIAVCRAGERQQFTLRHEIQITIITRNCQLENSSNVRYEPSEVFAES